MNKKFKIAIVFSAILALPSIALAQCKGFTKRHCLPELKPYISNGQINSAHMIPGDSASINLLFQKDISYRMIICADPYLESMHFNLKDKGTSLYKDTINEYFSVVDLKIDQNKRLNLNLNVPQKENATEIARNGCVTVLIGFKEN